MSTNGAGQKHCRRSWRAAEARWAQASSTTGLEIISSSARKTALPLPGFLTWHPSDLLRGAGVGAGRSDPAAGQHCPRVPRGAARTEPLLTALVLPRNGVLWDYTSEKGTAVPERCRGL